MPPDEKQSPARSDLFYDRGVTAAAFEVELIARTPLSARVHQLRFSARAPFRWAAGQYVVVVSAGGERLFLPYSLASAWDPNQPSEFEIAAAFRAGADAIDDLGLGGVLEVEGPAGEFTWQPTPSPAALLVGVGTGIAPLRALIQEELARRTDTRLLLLAGHRAPEDVLFHEDFSSLARAEPRFQFVPTLTGEAALWAGRRGRVQMQLAEAVRALGPLDAYVCGRLDMVNEVVLELAALGVPAARTRSEGY
jgi:NAD(P)H-flavin reductase